MNGPNYAHYNRSHNELFLSLFFVSCSTSDEDGYEESSPKNFEQETKQSEKKNTIHFSSLFRSLKKINKKKLKWILIWP